MKGLIVAFITAAVVVACKDKTEPNGATAASSVGETGAPAGAASASATVSASSQAGVKPLPPASEPGRVAIWNRRSLTPHRWVGIDGEASPADLGKGASLFYVFERGQQLLVTVVNPRVLPKHEFAIIPVSEPSKRSETGTTELRVDEVSQDGKSLMLRRSQDEEYRELKVVLRDRIANKEVSLPEDRCVGGKGDIHPGGRKALIACGRCACFKAGGGRCKLDLCELDLDAGATRELRKGDHLHPKYGQDGRAYFLDGEGAGEGDWNIVVAALSDPKAGKTLVKGVEGFALSPYAPQLVYTVPSKPNVPNSLHVAELDGDNARKLFSHQRRLWVGQFSLDGKWLSLSVMPQDVVKGDSTVHACPLAGGDCVSMGKGMARGWVAD